MTGEQKDYYIRCVKEFIEISNNRNKCLTSNDLVNNTYGLPSSRWFVKHCPNKDVKNFNDFIEWCGFIPNRGVSKDKATQVILDMQSKLGRPLMYDDFINPSTNEIGIRVINRHWGTLNKMKKDLGLEVVQENMVAKSKSIEDAKDDIQDVCNEIYLLENRNTLTISDFNNRSHLLKYQTYYKYFKDIGESLREYVESLGFYIVEPSCGLTHRYSDGEVVLSQYELQISNFLRNNNLKYNIDYFKDVKYKYFIQDYDGNMSCDYIIKINNCSVFIEIVGFLRDYEKHYYNDLEINNSSKERYKQKLQEKEQMLRSSSLSYYILFPQSSNERDELKGEDIDELFKIITKY